MQMKFSLECKYLCAGLSNVQDVNEARYKLFCSAAGSDYSMPPCKNALLQHTRRANYQAAIWKKATNAIISAPEPISHGWEMVHEQYSVVWNTGPTAPSDVLLSVYYKCAKKQFVDGRCSCKQASLEWTDICGCTSCKNTSDVVQELPYEEDVDEDF